MKWKLWELSLIMAVVITLLCGFVLEEGQQELSDKLIRLHVLANSDGEADQELKLYVRDRVLLTLDHLLEECETQEAAQQVIEENLDVLTASADQAVSAWGEAYPVRVTLEQERFPTRIYDTFSLPAGRYTSLRIEIGEGDGQNWWCVVFPPLCVTAAEGGTVETGALTEQDLALITEADTGYVVKFRALELLDSVREWLS